MLARFLVAAALGGMALIAASQPAVFPDRPVKLIVPTVPGPPPDVVARLVAEKLSARLAHPVVVENRPGAVGSIGLQAVARAPADGYTLGLLAMPYVVAPSLLPQVPYDIERDFAPVALINWSYAVLAVPAASPAHSLDELIAEAKARPGGLKYASSGNGTPPHLAGEMLKRSAGIELMHVPYKGTPASITALLSAEVDFAFVAPGPLGPHVAAGRVRLLATPAPRRLAAYPDLPTLSELGHAVEVSDWQGIVAPSGTPAARIKRLHDEIHGVVLELSDRLRAIGMEPADLGPEEFRQLVRSENAKWRRVVRESGIRID
jgi:tripartite-type tricarboxylate transporter receptor subunit TctC